MSKKLTAAIKSKKLTTHEIKKNFIGVLDEENKLAAQGFKDNNKINWTWIRKDFK